MQTGNKDPDGRPLRGSRRYRGMSLMRGLTFGMVIAGLYLLAGHVQIENTRFSFRGNSALALAVAAVLVPLAIVWGWTWVSDRWSGRSGPRLLLFTLGLIVGTALAFPLDHLVFPTPGASTASPAVLPILAIDGVLFVLPAVAVAAILYWAFGSGKVPLVLPTLAIGYLASLPVALLFPPAAMGLVAGTAAGHAWRTPGARTLITMLVIFIMLIATFELPMAAAAVEAAALP